MSDAGRFSQSWKPSSAPVLLFRHFGMNHAPASQHPLQPAAFQQPRVSSAVAVAHLTRDQIGQRLETAMRMIRKAGPVIPAFIAPETVQQQKGIEPAVQSLTDDASQFHARPFRHGTARDELLDNTAGSR